MAENENFETLGDAYAKYPQSTLVMRKQYVDEKDARIAQLEAKPLISQGTMVASSEFLTRASKG